MISRDPLAWAVAGVRYFLLIVGISMMSADDKWSWLIGALFVGLFVASSPVQIQRRD